MNVFKTAADAADWITGTRWKGEKHGLENTRALLSQLGDPELRMGKILHVAGTNGKGSTCAYLDAALRECGYRVGLFTSPYLRRFGERIQFDGRPIPDEDLIDVASRVREAAEALTKREIYCTTFELLTACACLYYADKGADYSVMEVGLGGRLDSTNVLPSSVSLVAAIGMDHMSLLGNTVEEIAAEKAGIFKPGVPAFVMPGEPGVMDVFRKAARDAGAPLYICDGGEQISYRVDGSDFRCTLPGGECVTASVHVPGAHQIRNACLALSALTALPLDREKVLKGIARAEWPGRLQTKGNVLIDCGHNPQGARTLEAYVHTFFADRKIVLLTGMMQDKQIEACSAIFSAFADRVVTTAVDWPRALAPEKLAEHYPDKPVCAVSGVENALKEARRQAGEDGLVVCAGSVYIAGAVLNLLEEK